MTNNIKNNFKFLVFILLFSFIACTQVENKNNDEKSSSNTIEEKAEVQEINASKFKELVDNGNVILIDVREPSELIEDGYIENAINVPAYRIEKLWDEKVKAKKDDIILTYCLSGYRSNVASEELIKMGYKNVYSLSGGISSWKSNNYPVIK